MSQDLVGSARQVSATISPSSQYPESERLMRALDCAYLGDECIVLITY